MEESCPLLDLQTLLYRTADENYAFKNHYTKSVSLGHVSARVTFVVRGFTCVGQLPLEVKVSTDGH